MSERSHIPSGGGGFAFFQTIPAFFTTMIIILGVIALVIIIAGGICIWPFMYGQMQAGSIITSGQTVGGMIANVAAGLLAGVISLFFSKEKSNGSHPVMGNLMPACMAAFLTCFVVNAVLMCCMHISIVPVLAGAPGKVLAMLINGVCCMMLAVLPAIATSVLDLVGLGIIGLIRGR